MTLIIAFILLAHVHAEWWWYIIVGGVWQMHVMVHRRADADEVAERLFRRMVDRLDAKRSDHE